MSAAEQYILGNGVTYARLCLVTEVLGKFVAGAPRAVGIAQLENQTGRSARELQKLCAMLCREGLLQPDAQQAHHWTLACDASLITLEDAFRCAIAEQSSRGRQGKEKAASEAAETPRREVDLLVMQATMGIQQSVFQHLRQFSLDRLKVGAGGMFSPYRTKVWPRLSYS